MAEMDFHAQTARDEDEASAVRDREELKKMVEMIKDLDDQRDELEDENAGLDESLRLVDEEIGSAKTTINELLRSSSDTNASTSSPQPWSQILSSRPLPPDVQLKTPSLSSAYLAHIQQLHISTQQQFSHELQELFNTLKKHAEARINTSATSTVAAIRTSELFLREITKLIMLRQRLETQAKGVGAVVDPQWAGHYMQPMTSA